MQPAAARAGVGSGRSHAAIAYGGTATVNRYDVTSQPEKVGESISLTGQFATGGAKRR